jgi:hypothetical protein
MIGMPHAERASTRPVPPAGRATGCPAAACPEIPARLSLTGIYLGQAVAASRRAAAAGGRRVRGARP